MVTVVCRSAPVCLVPDYMIPPDRSSNREYQIFDSVNKRKQERKDGLVPCDMCC